MEILPGNIYSEGGSFERGPQLPIDQYKVALLRMVKYCHDVVFIDKEGRFVLPKRASNKTPPWVWFFGGQVDAFTDIKASLKKTILRETGLTIDENRYQHVGQVRCFFNGKDAGGVSHDSMSEVFAILLTDEEIKNITLDQSEYEADSLRPYTLEEIRKIEDEMPRQVLSDLWKKYNAS